MDRFLARTQLHDLLKCRGHTFSSAKSDEASIDVCPSPETYITVGLDIDGTLKPAYRERYFACVRNGDDQPLLLHDPTFALAEPFATAAERESRNNYFVMGPVRWLLVRIRRFERVWVWPRGGFRNDEELGFLDKVFKGEQITQAPHSVHWFARHAPDPSLLGAALLSLSDLDDCQALWEVANLVGECFYDFFLSDPACQEVYMMHHHDKLVISIPDAQNRRKLLEELTGLGGLFDDCSGYSLESDER
jgi:hypothetical protein